MDSEKPVVPLKKKNKYSLQDLIEGVLPKEDLTSLLIGNWPSSDQGFLTISNSHGWDATSIDIDLTKTNYYGNSKNKLPTHLLPLNMEVSYKQLYMNTTAAADVFGEEISWPVPVGYFQHALQTFVGIDVASRVDSIPKYPVLKEPYPRKVLVIDPMDVLINLKDLYEEGLRMCLEMIISAMKPNGEFTIEEVMHSYKKNNATFEDCEDSDHFITSLKNIMVACQNNYLVNLWTDVAPYLQDIANTYIYKATPKPIQGMHDLLDAANAYGWYIVLHTSGNKELAAERIRPFLESKYEYISAQIHDDYRRDTDIQGILRHFTKGVTSSYPIKIVYLTTSHRIAGYTDRVKSTTLPPLNVLHFNPNGASSLACERYNKVYFERSVSSIKGLLKELK